MGKPFRKALAMEILPYGSIIAPYNPLDEIVDHGFFSCFYDLLTSGMLVAHPDIFINSIGKQDDVLHYNADVGEQFTIIHLPDVHTTDDNA